jgi:endonuclease YncB( thermonuclease family)
MRTPNPPRGPTRSQATRRRPHADARPRPGPTVTTRGRPGLTFEVRLVGGDAGHRPEPEQPR